MIREIVEVPQTVPAGLLACEVEPAAPANDAGEPTFWAWVLDVVSAGRDCRFKLQQVRGLSQP